MFFTCCILHNILHKYNGLDVLEANVHWAGKDGLHDPTVANPMTDTSSIGLGGGSRKSDEQAEVESSHDGLKRRLITSFVYRRNHNDISWLST